jgi:hypothetical protein
LTDRLVEPQGDEKLTLPLLVMTLTVKVADCSPVMFWLDGETVILAAPEAAARIVPGSVLDHRVTVMVAEPFFGTRSGLGETPMEQGAGAGVGVAAGVGVGVGVAVTCLSENPVHFWVASS